MFDKLKSKQIKGIAIMMMLFHHLYHNLDRIPYGYSYPKLFYIGEYDLINFIAIFCKICVSIYMFIGGYSLYLSISKNKESNLKIFCSRVVKLYKEYWKVFLIFIPIGYLFFSGQIQYTSSAYCFYRFNEFRFNYIFEDFIGITNYFNGEWWFFKQFIMGLFLTIIFINIFKKNNNIFYEIIGVLIQCILITVVFKNVENLTLFNGIKNNFIISNLLDVREYTIIMLIGVLYSKYKLFDKLDIYFNRFKMYEKVILSFVIILLIMYFRVIVVNYWYSYAADIILVPFFIFACCKLIDSFSKFKGILGFVGKYSTPMWFIHSFYCYYYGKIAKFIYLGNNPLVSFLKLFWLTLISAILVEYIWKIIGKLYCKFRNLKYFS